MKTLPAFLLSAMCLGMSAPVWAQLHGPRIPDSLSVQGYLTDELGDPITGPTNLTFKLYKGSNEIWSQTKSGVTVANGLFSVILGGAGAASLDTVAFDQPIELGITVETDAEIVPRTSLTAAPFALGMRGLYAYDASESIGTAPNIVGGATNNYVAPGIVGVTLSGGGGLWGALKEAAPDSVMGSWGTISGGLSNTVAGNYSTIAGGRGNAARDSWATVSGGQDNLASGERAVVAGGQGNVASGDWTSIGGGSSNTATHDRGTIAGGGGNSVLSEWATVGGGSGNSASGSRSTVAGGYQNVASGDRAALGGGDGNAASGSFSTVGGGVDNTAVGGRSVVAGGSGNMAGDEGAAVGGGAGNSASGVRATIAGGYQNVASASRATVGGGSENTASQQYATIGGGDSNEASGRYSTVPGGRLNKAMDRYSFAAGFAAEAHHTGTFVWADSASDAGTAFQSTDKNQFIVRADGGVGINTNAPLNELHVVGSHNAAASVPNHVAVLDNISTGTSADVLALRIGRSSAPDTTNSFVTFVYNSGVGAGFIRGNGSGGVELVSSGSDYAEYLAHLLPNEILVPGDVVGVFHGRIARRTEDADQIMVVSTAPIVVGNHPVANNGEPVGSSRVAFIGQAPVRVRGAVREGDFLLPSGFQDGTAVAIDPAEVTPDQLNSIFATAWESKPDAGIGKVNAAIGIDQTAAAHRVIEALHERTKRLEASHVAMAERLAEVERRMMP